MLSISRSSGATILAEDLGSVPDFVRESLARFGIPGCKVFRWERHWDRPGKPYLDPATYPAVSVATSGTHDTDPVAVWWDGLDAEERAAVLATPGVAERAAPLDAVGLQEVGQTLDEVTRVLLVVLAQRAQHAVVEDLQRQRVLQAEQKAVGAQIVKAREDVGVALQLADLDGVGGLIVALPQIDERPVRPAETHGDRDLRQQLADGGV